ncbi:MAG: hypothetical protein Q8O76_00260, partial [Chloroflexota bacterium]|nr:hypothetical protein [Chloroflexota bacterium]
LKDILADIGRIVSGAVTTILSWILKWVYRLTRGMLLQYVGETHRFWFPSVSDEETQAPYIYARRVFHLVGEAVLGMVTEGIDWLWRQVKAGLGYAVSGFGTLIDWIRQRTQDAVEWLWGVVKAGLGYAVSGVGTLIDWIRQRTQDVVEWLWDQVKAGLGYAAKGFATLIDWIRKRTQDAVEWLWDQVWAGLEWLWDNVISKIPEGIVAGAAVIGGLIRDAFEWLVRAAFEPFVDVVKAKLAIPGKLIRAEYTSLEELLDDMLDPPAEMLKGWTGMILLPFIVVGLLVNMVTGLSGPLLEPILQEQARSVGARIPTYQMLRDGFLRDLLPEGVHDDWLGR